MLWISPKPDSVSLSVNNVNNTSVKCEQCFSISCWGICGWNLTNDGHFRSHHFLWVSSLETLWTWFDRVLRVHHCNHGSRRRRCLMPQMSLTLHLKAEQRSMDTHQNFARLLWKMVLSFQDGGCHKCFLWIGLEQCYSQGGPGSICGKDLLVLSFIESIIFILLGNMLDKLLDTMPFLRKNALFKCPCSYGITVWTNPFLPCHWRGKGSNFVSTIVSSIYDTYEWGSLATKIYLPQIHVLVRKGRTISFLSFPVWEI